MSMYNYKETPTMNLIVLWCVLLLRSEAIWEKKKEDGRYVPVELALGQHLEQLYEENTTGIVKIPGTNSSVHITSSRSKEVCVGMCLLTCMLFTAGACLLMMFRHVIICRCQCVGNHIVVILCRCCTPVVIELS